MIRKVKAVQAPSPAWMVAEALQLARAGRITEARVLVDRLRALNAPDTRLAAALLDSWTGLRPLSGANDLAARLRDTE